MIVGGKPRDARMRLALGGQMLAAGEALLQLEDVEWAPGVAFRHVLKTERPRKTEKVSLPDRVTSLAVDANALRPQGRVYLVRAMRKTVASLRMPGSQCGVKPSR
jgi:hypothetical protein